MSENKEKKRIFIGSSSESKRIADAVYSYFEYKHDTRIWSAVFDASTVTINEIIKQANENDFAIMILGEDDILSSRGETYSSARDNVILELGIFIGSLGLSNCFIIIPSSSEHKIKIASDLSGVTLLKYNSAKENPSESVLTACGEIERKIATSPKKNTPREVEKEIKINELNDFNNIRHELISNGFELDRARKESEILSSSIRNAFFSIVKPATKHEIDKWIQGAKSNSGFSGDIRHYNIFYTDKEVIVPQLYGADSIGLIVESGTKIYQSGNSHNTIYYMDGFRCNR